MSRARLVVTAVKIEGRSKSAVAREYGVSRRWVVELVKRFEADGEAGLVPRSRRPRSSPQRAPAEVEEKIVELRKQLTEQGLDAGAETIRVHLQRDRDCLRVPAVSTIWRILSRRGFITAQPQKRPRSPFARVRAGCPGVPGGARGGDDLADPAPPRGHPGAAAEATEVVLCPVRGGDAQRTVADRRRPLAALRRHRRGDPQPARRPLPARPRL